MARSLWTSVTRRSVVAGLALDAALVALAGADNAYAQAKHKLHLRKVCPSGSAASSPSRRLWITSAKQS
jgi:hypothetical protein